MPKKHRNPQLLTKPRPTAPPTFGSSSAASSSPFRSSIPEASSSSNTSSDSQSVNDILSRLRLSQSTRKTARANAVDPAFTTRTFHPSLQGIFTDAPAPLYLPPRQRSHWPNGVPNNYMSRRGTAGPPAPRSWVTRDQKVTKKVSAEAEGRAARKVLEGPGLVKVDGRSLTHMLLDRMAREWQEVFVYGRWYLWEMGTPLKALLLAYIAAYSSTPIDIPGLEILFGHMDDEEEEEDTDSDSESTPPESPTDSDFSTPTLDPSVTNLTLSHSLGRTMTLKDLKTFLTLSSPSSLPDSWDTDATLSTHRFPNLTHLNLSYPATNAVSWPRFFDFARSAIPTITHLSLAGWPSPGDLSSLIMLSNSLLCLKWFDLTDCPIGFIKLLAELRWDGAWKKMEIVCVGVCIEELEDEELSERREVARALQERIWGTQPKQGVVCKVVM